MEREGSLRIARGVFLEVQRKTDRLWRAVSSVDSLVVDVMQDPRARGLLAEIQIRYGNKFKVGSQSYNGFWHSPSGRNSAEAQVIALAKAQDWLGVVSEGTGKLICLAENVAFISWEEFARRVITQENFGFMFGGG